MKTAIETEKKYRLNERQREQILKNLREIGAAYKGEDFEENIIFQESVLSDDSPILRIRKIENRAILTYKKAVQNEFAVKQRAEYETEVSDAEATENIVVNVGFVKSLVYEKRRKTWRFRSVEIVLDELPFGSFMEIEGSVTAIVEAEMLLEAEDFEVVHETYPRLTAEWGKQNGDVIEARFSENFL